MATDFSFESSKLRVLERLRSQADWAKILPTSTNSILINAFVEEIQELARYLEQTALNNRWKFSKNRASIVGQAQLYNGYKPHRKKAAKGNLRISANENAFPEKWFVYRSYDIGDKVQYEDLVYTSLVDSNVGAEPSTNPLSWNVFPTTYFKTVGIPKFSEFSTEEGVIYTSIAAKTLTPSDNFIEVPIVQGVPKSFQTTTIGNIFEEIEVINDSTDTDIKELYIDNELWTEIDEILDADSDEKRYQVINKTDFSGVILRFGDGNNGRKLTPGQTLSYRYVETNGNQGNISSEGSVSIVNSTVSDVNGDLVQLYCYNAEEITGGKDYETIDEIRKNAPKNLNASDNIVGRLDYEVAMSAFSFVEKVVVWGAYEQNKDNNVDLWTFIDTEENLVYISAFTPGENPLQLTETNKIEIIESIKDKKGPRDIIRFVDTEFVEIAFDVLAFLSNSSILVSEMAETIRNSVTNRYQISEREFKEDIYESEYKAFIQSIEGIQNHTSRILQIKSNTFVAGDDGASTPYQGADQYGVFPLKPNTLELYIRDNSSQSNSWILVGTDNGSGAFTAETGYDLTGSSINYNDGSFSLVVQGTSPTGPFAQWDWKLYAEPLSNDLLLTKRNQIVFLKEVITDVRLP
jgi:hypothetical protein